MNLHTAPLAIPRARAREPLAARARGCGSGAGGEESRGAHAARGGVMFCDEHGTLDYCPDCLASDPKQAALAILERAVIEAAAAWQRARSAPSQGDILSDPFYAAADSLGIAVDALLAALEG